MYPDTYYTERAKERARARAGTRERERERERDERITPPVGGRAARAPQTICAALRATSSWPSRKGPRLLFTLRKHESLALMSVSRIVRYFSP